jgi:hypothetical protein
VENIAKFAVLCGPLSDKYTLVRLTDSAQTADTLGIHQSDATAQINYSAVAFSSIPVHMSWVRLFGIFKENISPHTRTHGGIVAVDRQIAENVDTVLE